MSSPDNSEWIHQSELDARIAEALAAHNVSAGTSGTISTDQVQDMINQALARQQEAHNEEMRGLAASMRGSVVTFVPQNAGGPGTEIAETWSQYEQTLAHAADDAAKQQKAAAPPAFGKGTAHQGSVTDSLFPAVR